MHASSAKQEWNQATRKTKALLKVTCYKSNAKAILFCHWKTLAWCVTNNNATQSICIRKRRSVRGLTDGRTGHSDTTHGSKKDQQNRFIFIWATSLGLPCHTRWSYRVDHNLVNPIWAHMKAISIWNLRFLIKGHFFRLKIKGHLFFIIYVKF
jgi:hypothetical protein